MRIPRRVNAVLDWWSRTVWRFAADNPGLAIAVLLGVAAFATRPVMPLYTWPIAFFAAGTWLGWMCHSPAIWQRDDRIRTLLVENDRLRRDNAHMLRGHQAADEQETAQPPRLGERP